MDMVFDFYKYFDIVPNENLAALNAAATEVYDREDSMLPIKIITNPVSDEYAEERQLQRTVNFSNYRTEKGRLFYSYFSSSEHCREDAGTFNLIVSSDDGGKTWKNRFLLQPQNPNSTRTFDNILFGDGTGRMWLFWSQYYGLCDGRGGVWCAYCDNPDDDEPTFSEPKRIANGQVSTTPIILKNGDWLLPLYTFAPHSVHGCGSPMGFFWHWIPEDQGVRVYRSQDQGETWECISRGINFPYKTFEESCMIEREDGALWMLIRGRNCTGETFSYDGGKTWTPPRSNTKYNFPDTHFYFNKLKSGNILMLANYKADMYSSTGGRNNLTAMISRDDGATWEGFLMIDEREGSEQPSFCEGNDGFIYINYGRAPCIAGESLMAIVTEEDIFAGKLVNEKSRLRILTGKSTGMRNGPNAEYIVKLAKESNIEL